MSTRHYCHVPSLALFIDGHDERFFPLQLAAAQPVDQPQLSASALTSTTFPTESHLFGVEVLVGRGRRRRIV